MVKEAVQKYYKRMPLNRLEAISFLRDMSNKELSLNQCVEVYDIISRRRDVLYRNLRGNE